jgi:hypothetical protein
VKKKKKKKVLAFRSGRTNSKPNGSCRATPKQNEGGFEHPHFGIWGGRPPHVAQSHPYNFLIFYFKKKIVWPRVALLMMPHVTNVEIRQF